MKKAMELAVLCDVQVALMIVDDASKKEYVFCSRGNVTDVVQPRNDYVRMEEKSSDDIQTIVKNKENRKKQKGQEYSQQGVSDSSQQPQQHVLHTHPAPHHPHQPTTNSLGLKQYVPSASTNKLHLQLPSPRDLILNHNRPTSASLPAADFGNFTHPATTSSNSNQQIQHDTGGLGLRNDLSLYNRLQDFKRVGDLNEMYRQKTLLLDGPADKKPLLPPFNNLEKSSLKK